MNRTSCLLPVIVAMCVLTGIPPSAQSSDDSVTGFILPVGDLPDRVPLPRFVLRPSHEIPLPGPLPGLGPVLTDDGIRIPVAGGVALTQWSAGATPVIASGRMDDAADNEPMWVEAPDGQRRYRTLPEGRLVSQKACKRCRGGWRTRWTLQVAGGTVSPAVVTVDRIFFGALDNRVYALKRRNGHQRWVAGVEGRVAVTPLYVPLENADPRVQGALVVVSDAKQVVVLSTRRGDTLGRLELDNPDDRFVGGPLLMQDGSIALACQRYRDEEAALLVYRLEEVGGEGAGRPPSRPGSAISRRAEQPRP